MKKHISLMILAACLGVLVYGCQQGTTAKAPEGGNAMSVVGSEGDASGKLKSKFDDANAPPKSGGCAGQDSQCTAMETLDCDYTANCHGNVGGGQTCMYFTARKSPNFHYYNTPCTLTQCGFDTSSGIPLPLLGMKLGTSHGAVPGTYDREEDCSDGSPCYHVYCGTKAGLHMYRY